MKSWSKMVFSVSAVLLTATLAYAAAPTPSSGWGEIARDVNVGNFWDRNSNRHYGGFNNAFTWPGGWWDNGASAPVERRTMSNYQGFIIGATNVNEPQFPGVVWPFMVGQRDGRNDGESGTDILSAAPDVTTPNAGTQILFKGRLSRRTFRQAQPVVTVDGVVNARLANITTAVLHPEIVGDEADGPYQDDAVDATIPADLVYETKSATRMGISTNRKIYAFVDRDNDDYNFWHWRMINDGIWGRAHIDKVDCCGNTHGTVTGVMMGLMFQWDRSSAGANRTGGAGEGANDSIWRYYGVDYDGARTEDMRLVYVIDGDQADSKYAPAHGKLNDIGDPDPTTGELLSAKTAGWQILHYDVSGTDKNDDPAQPRTIGWVNYSNLIQTSIHGHEMKYNQMLLGTQRGETGYEFYPGEYGTTPGRGAHPLVADGASWIKASNNPAVSETYWPGKVLGVDIEVTDIEQQAGFGPDDMAAGDTINALHVMGINGITTQYAQTFGKEWLLGTKTDAEKDALVTSTIDSLFETMRQAKDVYETTQFGGRNASTRAEFETTLRDAIAAGKITLSPPAPATFTVTSTAAGSQMDWTLNTTTGSSIQEYRVYRALAGFKGDSAWTLVFSGPPSQTSWMDIGGKAGFQYYYYLTTMGADGTESTMFTRTDKAFIPVAVTSELPSVFDLSQNAPNPFNPSTVIRLSMAQAGPARLDIYNVTGQLVRTLVNENLAAGTHEVTWDGTDAAGRALASGTYIYRLSNDDNVRVRRMVLAR